MTSKKRFFLILHLTFALTYLIWVVSKPLLEETIVRKQMKLIVLSLIEDKQYFPLLPEEKQIEIKNSRHCQKKILPSSRASPFALAWIFFSIAIALLFLFDIEGARLAVLILPLLTLCMIFFPQKISSTSSPFPSENEVLSYLKSKNGSFKERKQELEDGWKIYLAKRWGGEEESYQKGCFNFSLYRIEHFLKTGESQSITSFFAPPSFFSCILYFIWNTFFAYFMYKQKKQCII